MPLDFGICVPCRRMPQSCFRFRTRLSWMATESSLQSRIFRCMPRNLLRLYRYVLVPFLLDEQKVLLEIISPAEYLSLDTHGMVWKQLAASEFQLCRRLGSVYHCLNMNLVNKDLKSLCLYDIYSQTPTLVEQTCEAQVSYLKNHAVQLSTSLYRILVVNPVQLVMDCKSGRISPPYLAFNF